MIVYSHDAQGAFIAGDTETRITCYAFPTSPNAVAAKKRPDDVAADMIRKETDLCSGLRAKFQSARDYDTRNWILLGQPLNQY